MIEQPDAVGLGAHLKSLREGCGKSLRQIEWETNKRISNAYLSQIESGHIKSPSPHILRALASSLRAPYSELMRMAGYLTQEEADAVFSSGETF